LKTIAIAVGRMTSSSSILLAFFAEFSQIEFGAGDDPLEKYFQSAK